jgi:transposase
MRLQNAELEFAGQTVFVGIDVGLKSWKVCVIVGDREHRTFSQDPEGKIVSAYVRRLWPGARYRCAYEAGYFGFAPHASLTAEGLECIVVNPGDVPTMDKERVTKTDRVDARKLARGLQAGILTGIHIPSLEEQSNRTLVRTRQSFVRKQTRCKNQIKAYVQYYGLRLPAQVEGRHWSREFIAWLEHMAQEDTARCVALRIHLDELLFLRGRIAVLTKQIRGLGMTDRYRESLALLRSLPGIDVITGMILLTELGDLHRFRDENALASYVGLVPGEHSSGEHEQRGRMTRRRNAWLRHILIEAAWQASAKDPVLMQEYLKRKAKHNAQYAIVRIARKLLRRIRYVLIHRTAVKAA